MPAVIRCPHCQKAMQLPDNALGKKVACPMCKKPFMAPAPVAAGVAAAPAPAAAAATPPAAAPAHDNGNGTATTPTPSPTICPSWGAKLLEGAVACMDCGYLLKADTGPAEAEGAPNLCPNPACGVANPPGERYCQ